MDSFFTHEYQHNSGMNLYSSIRSLYIFVFLFGLSEKLSVFLRLAITTIE